MREHDVQRNITAFWGAVARDYEAHGGNVVPVDSPEYQAWVALYRDALPPAPADVLDVGTGTGFGALIAATLGHRVTGVDLAERMLAVAREHAAERGLEARFVSGDAVAPPLPDASCDAVTCRHLLWTLRDLDGAFAAWRRVLRPGGRLVAIDGFWFEDDARPDAGPDEPPPSPDEDLFGHFYTRATRAALPAMRATNVAPYLAALAGAGFDDVTVTHLPPELAVGDDGRVPFLLTARR